MPDIHIEAHGAILNGTAEQEVDAFLSDAQLLVAHQASAEVHNILDLSIRNPTPYYETQIVVQRMQPDVVVHDRGIVYGPWLEGVSERNKTTRFKGYAAFRRARDRIAQQVPTLLADQVDDLMGRL